MSVMPHKTIRLVCFDLGGVIIRICRTWLEACRRAGLPVRDGIEGVLQREIETRRELNVLHQTGRLDTPEYFQRVSATLNGLYSPDDIRAIHYAWLVDEYEGLTDVIDAIHDAGLKTAALSNTNPEHWQRMQEFPSVMRLQHRFGSHELGFHKPDEAIYRALEENVNIRGSDILFFDDLQDNIDAARECGWNSVLIDHTSPTDVQIICALQTYKLIEA